MKWKLHIAEAQKIFVFILEIDTESWKTGLHSRV
jgi:hypothetical protein